MKGQGATRPACEPVYHLLGQGATEYLVLLAVVLIVALVSVALLGFFPGMASDAQRQQSEMYWRSASPIAISEWSAIYSSGVTVIYPYLRLRNNGVYPIRVTALIGADGGKTTQFYGSNCGASYPPLSNISDYFYLASGEEKYLAQGSMFGLPCTWNIYTYSGATSGTRIVGGASSVCQNSTSSPGVLQYNSFGFEYIEYLDNNQQIIKRQIGKQVIIKCLPAQ